jgi:hypothetical protein
MRERVPALISVISLMWFCLVGSATWGQENVPVDGDQALFRMIRKAQHANEGRYPFGELEVVVESGSSQRKLPIRRVEALVRWDKDQVRLSGTFFDPDPVAGAAKGEAKVLRRREFDLIYRNSRSAIYISEQKQMTISDTSRQGYILLTRLRPQDWWYGKINGDEPSVAERLDGLLRLSPEISRRVSVRRLADDQVEIFTTEGIPDTFRAVYSLKDEGNLVSREGADPAHGFREKRTYTWARDARNRCYMKACRIDRSFRNTPHGPNAGYHTYEVKRFDPDKRPSESTFEEGSIPVAIGTVVNDNITGKTRRIGVPSAGGIGPPLDELVPE